MRAFFERTFCKFTSHCKGTMAVEISLVAPVIMVGMLGVYEVSRIIDSQLTLQNAARVGTNQALIRPPVQSDVSDIRSAVANTLPGGWTGTGQAADATIVAILQCECGDGSTISCTASCTGNLSKQTYVKVTVSRPHTLGFQSVALPASIPLSASSIVRLQ